MGRTYCGLVDARISASEKDLPVHIMILWLSRVSWQLFKNLVWLTFCIYATLYHRSQKYGAEYEDSPHAEMKDGSMKALLYIGTQ